jgi:type III secretion protein W
MDPRTSGASPVNPNSLRILQEAARQEGVRQSESETDMEQWCELEAFNPMAMMRRFRPLTEFKQKEKPEEQKLDEHKKVLALEKSEEAASRFQKGNQELQAKTLLILKSRISASDTPDDVIKKVLETYPDPALADESLDFLLENSDEKMADIVRQAKEKFNQSYEREIKAGRNMGAQAREFSKEGLGSPTTLRDMYRDITHSPREPLKLFEELSDKYNFEKLRTIIRFLLHSLGADLRSKGASISRAELKRLIDETRSLQGILGIYRFFKSRMGLITRQFASYDLVKPVRLDFEIMAKQFVKFLTERFMSPDKILLSARLLGISEAAIAQLIIFTQMRDAIKQVAPRYYRTAQQKQELFNSFLKALEIIEDQLEEEEEKERDEKKKKKQ